MISSPQTFGRQELTGRSAWLDRLPRLVAANILIAAVYWALAILIFWSFSRYQMWPAPIWLPAGIAIFATLYIGNRSWPGILVGSLLTNTVTFHEPLLWGAIISLGNTVAPLMAVSVFRSKAQLQNPFGRTSHVFRLTTACIFHGAISATVGAVAIGLKSGDPAGAWLPRWFEWATSDAGASLFMLPLLLLLQFRAAVSLAHVRKRTVEFALTVLALLATLLYFLSRSTALPAAEAGALFLLLLPLLWISVRFSARIAYPIFAMVIIVVITSTLLGYGPYSGVDRGGNFIVFAQMVIGFGGAVLLLGAASEEQREAEQALRRLNRHLEEIVERRTAELQSSKRQLEKAALHDALTGLPNRRLLEERFSACRSSADRKCSRLVLLLIDLDLFKRVNDNYGHDAGDAVLVEAAMRLSGLVREYDLVARMGGDEFAVLLPELVHESDINSICDRIVQELSQPCFYAGNCIPMSPSIGVAGYPEDGRSWPSLYKAADEALYGAKRGGRSRWMKSSGFTAKDAESRRPL